MNSTVCLGSSSLRSCATRQSCGSIGLCILLSCSTTRVPHHRRPWSQVRSGVMCAVLVHRAHTCLTRAIASKAKWVRAGPILCARLSCTSHVCFASTGTGTRNTQYMTGSVCWAWCRVQQALTRSLSLDCQAVGLVWAAQSRPGVGMAGRTKTNQVRSQFCVISPTSVCHP